MNRATPPFAFDAARIDGAFDDEEAPPSSTERRTALLIAALFGVVACMVVAATVFAAAASTREVHAAAVRGQGLDAATLRRLAASPSDGRLLAVAADTGAGSEIRLAALNAMVEGACLQHREVLFGISTERFMAFEAVAGAVERVPGAAERLAATRRTMEQVSSDPWRLPRAEGSVSLGALVLRPVRQRAEFCARLLD